MEIRRTSRIIYVKLPDGDKAWIRYSVENGRLKLIETYTPPQHRGKGLARMLTDYAVRMAEEKGLVIEPICSYAVYYFIKNPDKRRLLAPEYRDMDLQKLFEQRLAEERAKEEK